MGNKLVVHQTLPPSQRTASNRYYAITDHSAQWIICKRGLFCHFKYFHTDCGYLFKCDIIIPVLALQVINVKLGSSNDKILILCCLIDIFIVWQLLRVKIYETGCCNLWRVIYRSEYEPRAF